MRLTRYTDYAIRVLLHLAAHEDRTVSIQAIAGAYGISKDHLMKVAQQLSKAGLVAAQRGRGGGLPQRQRLHDAGFHHRRPGSGRRSNGSCGARSGIGGAVAGAGARPGRVGRGADRGTLLTPGRAG